MKYLSYLEDNYISLERIQYSKGAKEFFAVVSDLSGGEPLRGRLDTFVGEDILGCAIGKKRGVIARLDKHKAILHQHIADIKKVSSNRKTADFDVIVGRHQIGIVNKTGSYESAILRMEHESYESTGFKGSVLIKREDNIHGVYVLNMYDLLVDMCRRTKSNLMQYHQILICSRWSKTAFLLTLSDTREAGIFFTKMYMDVTRCST